MPDMPKNKSRLRSKPIAFSKKTTPCLARACKSGFVSRKRGYPSKRIRMVGARHASPVERNLSPRRMLRPDCIGAPA